MLHTFMSSRILSWFSRTFQSLDKTGKLFDNQTEMFIEEECFDENFKLNVPSMTDIKNGGIHQECWKHNRYLMTDTHDQGSLK
jgi:hypothetical protein